MAERLRRRISKDIGEEAVEFALLDEAAAVSPSRPLPAWDIATEAPAATPIEAGADAGRYSPEFLELATPKLPALSRGNRARLLMQSPNRLYFYWSIGKNPFHILNRAVGHPGGYTLALRLVNLRTDDEQIHPVDERGNWWFDVDADSRYRAEIGFYAVNRPYIRVLYSNTVVTPRKSPSPRTADTAEWRVPAQKFARVLDAAGFARDAFDVALVGDDLVGADIAARSAFAQFTGRPEPDFAGIAADELRYAMLALASGVSVGELRGLISEHLFALLSSTLNLTADGALAVLKDKFEFDADEFAIEEQDAEAVFGASIVNFPKKPRKGRKAPGLEPLSSYLFKSPQN